MTKEESIRTAILLKTTVLDEWSERLRCSLTTIERCPDHVGMVLRAEVESSFLESVARSIDMDVDRLKRLKDL